MGCDVGEATLPSLYLHHSSFSNPSVASPTSQLILQPFFRFSYVTGFSLTSPGEPPMCLSLSLSISLYLYLSISLYLSLSISLSISLSLSLSIYLSLYLSISLSLSLSISLSLSLTRHLFSLCLSQMPKSVKSKYLA